MSQRHHRINRRPLRIHGLISIALGALLWPLVFSPTSAFADCSQADRNAGECRSIDASTGGDSVVVTVDTARPGSPGSGGSTGSSSTTESSTEATTPQVPPPPRQSSPPPPPRMPVLGSNDCQVVMAGMCRASSPPRNSPVEAETVTVAPTPPTPPAPPQFASELGSFQPERPGAIIQPGEWSMPRLPTNFIAQARTHTQRGELAGWPIEVRFIPIRYHWSFGDGARATFTDPGRPWSGWGLQQFQATPTSHVYRQPGIYTATVRVEYRVEFRFVGESFQRLSGTVSSNGPPQRIRVLTVSPLLLG